MRVVCTMDVEEEEGLATGSRGDCNHSEANSEHQGGTRLRGYDLEGTSRPLGYIPPLRATSDRRYTRERERERERGGKNAAEGHGRVVSALPL
jgi:hypothetical protein